MFTCNLISASIDLENFDETPQSVIEELCSQIISCNTSAEFQNDSSHSETYTGLFKVFKISQHLCSHLVGKYESEKQISVQWQAKYEELKRENEKLNELTAKFKEDFVQLKKELKRRTEMLAAAQHDILSTQNQDEYDQVGNLWLCSIFNLFHVF